MNGWHPIGTAPEIIRDVASHVKGVAGQPRCRAFTCDGREWFALWTGQSHGDPVTHYQLLGEAP